LAISIRVHPRDPRFKLPSRTLDEQRFFKRHKAFQQQVVREIETGRFSGVHQACMHYEIGGCGTINQCPSAVEARESSHYHEAKKPFPVEARRQSRL